MANKYFTQFKEEASRIETHDDLVQVIEDNLNPNVLTGKGHYDSCLNRWENGLLHQTNGNDKVGEDTGIVNCSSAHNCYSKKMGYCNNKCGKCYAQAQEEQYAQVLMNGLMNEAIIDEISQKEFTAQIREFHDEKELLFHRWDSFGEFKSPTVFGYCNGASRMLQKHNGVLSYSYTHNKELPVDNASKSFITMNFSYDVKDGYKQCIIAKPSDLHLYLDSTKYIICLGDCLNCPYCKDRNDTRTVVFVHHGNGKGTKSQLKLGLSPKQLYLLKVNRIKDLGDFQERLIDFYF